MAVAFASVLLVSSGRVALAQTMPEASPTPAIVLNVGGEVPTALHLSQEDLLKLPRTEVHAEGKDGKESTCAGTSLTEILLTAGLKFDPGMMPAKGAIASYVVVEAADGYKAVFALAEFDPTQNDRVILLADHKDGQLLTAPEGPLRVIAPSEKRQARWVRQVIFITVHQS